MRLWIALAAITGFLAVAFGAFGAHGLKNTLSPERLGWIDTATRYAFWHALAILAVAIMFQLQRGMPLWSLEIAAWSFVVGIVLFSGGLIVMALADWRGLGAIVPIGGVAFLIGWASIAIGAIIVLLAR
jgi:uncharacterized membrane protein YgdD (TMEM256/DUF423 family)